jgi:hypothetical protein
MEKNNTQKEIKIIKSIENGLSTYNLTTTPNMDKDELLGILQVMMQMIMSQNPTEKPVEKKAEYIG